MKLCTARRCPSHGAADHCLHSKMIGFTVCSAILLKLCLEQFEQLYVVRCSNRFLGRQATGECLVDCVVLYARRCGRFVWCMGQLLCMSVASARDSVHDSVIELPCSIDTHQRNCGNLLYELQVQVLPYQFLTGLTFVTPAAFPSFASRQTIGFHNFSACIPPLSPTFPNKFTPFCPLHESSCCSIRFSL